jgi:ankyrin repeat protein
VDYRFTQPYVLFLIPSLSPRTNEALIAGPGDCGTWIVNAANGDLCGTIVASCEELSITYVLPMKNTWESIKNYHQNVNLDLPTTSNREIFVKNEDSEDSPRLVQYYEAAYRRLTMGHSIGSFGEFLEDKLCVECDKLGLFCDAHFTRSLPCSRCVHNGYACATFRLNRRRSILKYYDSEYSSYFREGQMLDFRDAWLRRAAANGHDATVKLLLEKGADVNATDKPQKTALMGAASFGHSTTVRLLLDKGGDVNATDKSQRTALMGAVKFGQSPTVRLLLDRGANINAIDKSSTTALMEAARFEHDGIVQLLLERGAEINAKDNNERTALMRAVRSENETNVRLLLEQGADIEVKTIDGQTALLEAVWFENEVIVQLLLERGADIEAKGRDGQTALQIASLNSYEKMVERLLEWGADPQAKATDGQTALQMASSRGHTKVVQLLLDGSQRPKPQRKRKLSDL